MPLDRVVNWPPIAVMWSIDLRTHGIIRVSVTLSCGAYMTPNMCISLSMLTGATAKPCANICPVETLVVPSRFPSMRMRM